MKKDYLAMTVGETFSLPPETIGEVPVVQMHGDRHVSIENHRGIQEYTDECVRVGVKRGSVLIRGSGLSIARMTRRDVEISGRLRSIELE